MITVIIWTIRKIYLYIILEEIATHSSKELHLIINEKANCNHCSSIDSYKERTTSNLKKHLTRKHPTICGKPAKSHLRPHLYLKNCQKLMKEYQL